MQRPFRKIAPEISTTRIIYLLHIVTEITVPRRQVEVIEALKDISNFGFLLNAYGDESMKENVRMEYIRDPIG